MLSLRGPHRSASVRQRRSILALAHAPHIPVASAEWLVTTAVSPLRTRAMEPSSSTATIKELVVADGLEVLGCKPDPTVTSSEPFCAPRISLLRLQIVRVSGHRCPCSTRQQATVSTKVCP